jgi:hypothetical protein
MRKAAETAKWATTMTKWLVTRTKSPTGWQLVEFTGPGGRESRGIVDLLAIRKDHYTSGPDLKRGDLFEVVLLQIKGGSARWPSRNDILRLRQVSRHHRATEIVLADWQRGNQPTLYRMARRLGSDFDPKSVWREVTADAVFGCPLKIGKKHGST